MTDYSVDSLYGGSAIWLDGADSATGWRFQGRAGSTLTSGHQNRLIWSGAAPYLSPLSHGKDSLNQAVITRHTPNEQNALNVMGPIYALYKKNSTRYSYLGYVEGLRCINRSVYLPGDSFMLGDSGTGDEWVVFPHHAQGGASTDPFYPSANNFFPQYGFAVKKVL
jgi:hypothetical protein